MDYKDNDYFEFEQEPELPEELDYQNLKPCPNCKKPIPQNAVLCMYCGEDATSSGKHTWIAVTALILLIIFILLVLF